MGTRDCQAMLRAGSVSQDGRRLVSRERRPEDAREEPVANVVTTPHAVGAGWKPWLLRRLEASSLRALPWAPAPSCQGPVLPHRRRRLAFGGGGVCSEACEKGGLVFGTGLRELDLGLPVCLSARLCSASHSGIGVQTGQVCCCAKAKAALSPGTWSPNNLSSLASTGKSRLRVPKTPRSQTNKSWTRPLRGRISLVEFKPLERGVSHTISLPPPALCAAASSEGTGDCGPRSDSPEQFRHLPSVSFDVVPKEP